MKSLFIILAVSGNFYNDVLALISIVGTFMMLLGSIPGISLPKMAAIGEWCLSAVFFGILFQVSIIATGMNPERIGFVLPMHPALVTGLFVASSLFLLCCWWLKRTQVRGIF
jgi:hypothetical protein